MYFCYALEFIRLCFVLPRGSCIIFFCRYGLTQYHSAILAFGVETVEDLCDKDILGDNELASELGMNRDDIRTFREATREAKNSGGFEILDELG